MMFIEYTKRKLVESNTIDDLSETIAKIWIKNNMFMPDCQTWLDVEKSTLKSPDNYGNNFTCSWVLTSKFGSYIKLHFNHIYVSSNFL